MTGTTRFASLAAALVLVTARSAVAQLSTAEVYQRIDMAVSSASAGGGGASDHYNLPPTTIPVAGSGSDSLPTKTLHVSTGGTATPRSSTAKERRLCRRDCKKRAKRCGQATGCALPVEL